MKIKLSVVIITLNEEKNIARCLDSIQEIADDIVVVDSFSVDKTEEICKNYQVRFIQHPFEGYIEQKNWAITQAKYQHVLSLDADEALDKTLSKSILNVKNNWSYDGYSMNRLTNYCGKWIKHCGWYPDKKLRLWDATKGSWTGINPHDKYELNKPNSEVKHLPGNILHYSYYTVDEHYKQTRNFAKIMAYAMFSKNKKSNFINRFISPAFRFFRDYFILRGILDGKKGFTICKITAFGTYLKYKNLHQLYLSQGKTTGIDNINTIIISRTDAIGDVILTLPMCGIIKHYYPNAKIIFIGKTYTEPIIKNCIHIDEFINADKLLQLNKHEALTALKQTQADCIIHVYPNCTIAKLAKSAGIKYRIGTTNRTYHWSTVNKFVKFSRKNSTLHEAQLNCKLLTPFGINIEPSLNELSKYTGFKKLHTNNYLSEHKEKKQIILHPKSNASAREWSLSNFKALIELLPSDQYIFYISGTNKEKEILKDWINTLPENVIDVTGKFDLEHFITFIANVDGLVAASTGPLHIAAASNICAIGIYPPLRPIHPGRWQPIGSNAHCLSVNKDCNACIGKPHECSCMNLILPFEVAKLIEQNC